MADTDRRFRLARLWSNQKLRDIGARCNGRVVNVSAGEDVDKEGGHYRDYFPNADSYTLTNHPDPLFRGFQGSDGEIPLDLREPLPAEHERAFDVVLNHTTLEHVYELHAAVDALCSMTRDLLVVVVPFAQVHHENPGYEDFWRFTPTGLTRLLADRGLNAVHLDWNRDVNAATYLVAVAAREPGRHAGVFGAAPKPYDERAVGEQAAGWIGGEPLPWADVRRIVRTRLCAWRK